MGQNSKTRAWELYEKGRQYNNSLTPEPIPAGEHKY